MCFEIKKFDTFPTEQIDIKVFFPCFILLILEGSSMQFFFAIVFLANKKTSKHYSMLFSIRVKPAWNQDLMNV